MGKICFLCTGIDGKGGLERVVSNLANQFCINDYEITFAILNNHCEEFFYTFNDKIKFDFLPELSYKKNNIFLRIFGKILRNTKIRLIHDDNLREFIYFNVKRKKILEKYLETGEYDYVIAIGCEMSLFLSAINRNNIKSKLIGWHHNSIEAYFSEKGKYCYGMKELAFKLYKNLDKLIVLTKNDKSKYEKGGLRNCETIYNPLSFTKTEILYEFQGKKDILFVGRLEWKQKGLDYLIDVIELINKKMLKYKWNFIIVGDGTDGKKFRKIIKEKKLQNNIKFIGYTNKVEQYYKKASILINTSRWEGFGLVITEAMQYGLPVIAFNTDGPMEIINDSQNGFIIPKFDTKLFSNKIMYLIENNEKRKEFSINSIKRAEDFKMENIFIKWENMLKELKKIEC